MASRNRMEVKIFGQSYVLHSARDEAEMRKVVSLATKAIQDSASPQTRYNNTMQATLACMNLADACLQAQAEAEAAHAEVKQAQEQAKKAQAEAKQCLEKNRALTEQIQQLKKSIGARSTQSKAKGSSGMNQ
ncbi:cell division protein ZapA [Murdochiella massiliensis]|uniref:cell division protein ZapA n=1 Tax=Murdochiella massiliensis TaxID=1673723 RepID=UPI000829BC0A|nr:cell division protein ZapA [Murdochiella massiliensis]